ncbi:ferredoxin family 2Fe-2S iron-sulfur cluster binding protein [Candidatus Sneabacter namystus]|uniref:Adrenodoxin-like protein n=1 Tax=Candidatus Sneabacter namystus TaxID=2601646 RepID=A0A5C0UJ27_9RICK|nr:ferredoxin family 2Fe-2S iron-sulfur cluster binding protein [Candidatus Sneabacter namystus]QEK39760.1 2Fe-2S iron-sulfur cluster binding domain-containing protein [Candidatus Sneabacter namystus]
MSGIPITFIYPDGTQKIVNAQPGLSVLEVAKQHDIPIEGACGGGLACSTCHVIVESQEAYDSLKAPSEEEEDMLDLAFGLEETSRLCCQILVDESLSGIKFKIPSCSRNL